MSPEIIPIATTDASESADGRRRKSRNRRQSDAGAVGSAMRVSVRSDQRVVAKFGSGTAPAPTVEVGSASVFRVVVRIAAYCQL
jgi:hypothetical protein